MTITERQLNELRELRDRLRENQRDDGTPLTSAERSELLSDIAQVESAIANRPLRNSDR